MLDMDDIQCCEAREKSLHQAGIGTCSLAWQVGFFFDGIHRNINQDSDTHRLSNVSRLFRAYPDRDTLDLDSSYLYSAIYIPGLGCVLKMLVFCPLIVPVSNEGRKPA